MQVLVLENLQTTWLASFVRNWQNARNCIVRIFG
jgi:hypothetical protein